MERNNLMLAALASSAMPKLNVAGVRTSEQRNQTDEDAGIDQAVVQDVRGNLYNVYVSRMPQGKRRLLGRARAASAIDMSREFAGLSFAIDQIVALRPANGPDDLDVDAVLITRHPDGEARSLDLLTLNDCASIGTAIATIHRMRPKFVLDSRYPAYTTDQIHQQLVQWIQRLRAAGHVPQEITDNWERVIGTEGMWAFATCPVHGGFSDGDFIFSGSTITTITNWQHMQINDPARDLAWIFARLDDVHRNAVLAAYGRMLGNRLDDLIMLRANLWVQMEQVGEFIDAINKGDNERIMQFKAQVDRLAHQIGVTRHRNETQQQDINRRSQAEPSTVTVNTLLRNDTMINDATGSSRMSARAPKSSEDTPFTDATGSAHVAATAMPPSFANGAPVTPSAPNNDTADQTASSGFVMHDWTDDGERVETDITGERRRVPAQQTDDTNAVHAAPAAVDAADATDATMDRTAAVSDSTANQPVVVEQVPTDDRMPAPQPPAPQPMAMDEFNDMIDLTYSKMVDAVQRGESVSASSSTQVIGSQQPDSPQAAPSGSDADIDDTGQSAVHGNAAETVTIPLLEREERAMQDARAGLESTNERLRRQ